MGEKSSIYIAGYAAVISTLVFVWRIIEFFDDRRGKLKIYLNEKKIASPIRIEDLPDFVKKIPEDLPNYQLGFKRNIEINIINFSKNKRLISNFPSIEIYKSELNNKELYFNPATMIKEYPLALEPGENFKIEIPLEDLLAENKGDIEIQCNIDDTYGKKYKSKTLKIKNHLAQV